MTVFIMARPPEPKTGIDWHKAACADTAKSPKTDLWFSDNKKKQARAREFCEECPIRRDCFLYAYDRNLKGIWGGYSLKQRAYLKGKYKQMAAQ